ncbi:MAG: PepSY-associated TM helix domain-containing protein [Sphingobium sp.]
MLKIVDARRGNASTTINNWLHPLHDGSVGGLATRILTFLCGLVPPTLFITGLLHWRRRRSARSAPRAARPASLHQRIVS